MTAISGQSRRAFMVAVHDEAGDLRPSGMILEADLAMAGAAVHPPVSVRMTPRSVRVERAAPCVRWLVRFAARENAWMTENLKRRLAAARSAGTRDRYLGRPGGAGEFLAPFRLGEGGGS
jgi:hypothetical protein